MNVTTAYFSNGEPYLNLQCETNWHQFPALASELLRKLQAYAIESPTKGQVIDAHWYEFSWNEAQYRLIYGDWPPECLIEKLTNDADLERLCKAISNIEIE